MQFDIYWRDNVSDREEYLNYLNQSDDGAGNDINTGEPLMTFEEWMAS